MRFAGPALGYSQSESLAFQHLPSNLSLVSELNLSELFGVVALPLSAAILFAFATLCLKAAAALRIDIWRVNFASNLVTALSFQPFWFGAAAVAPIAWWWQPAVVAVLYIVGQVLTLLSITRGDVSIAAPVLGLKLIFVPLFIAVIGAGALPTMIWPACTVACIGVAVLNWSPAADSRGGKLYSVATAASGAAAFALFDVCVQLWSSSFPGNGFLPLMFIGSTILSLSFCFGFEQPLRSLNRRQAAVLFGVGFFFAVQALAIVASVAFWHKAAEANVVYSTRGLWSLLVVAWLGAKYKLPGATMDRKTLGTRCIGAVLLLLAIVLLLVEIN